MKKPEDIVNLMKSLSGPEKRYFKVFVAKNSIGESNHYLKLFTLIDKTGSSERKVIEKLYNNEAFMKKHFRTYKHLLYKQILKSLKSYHSQRSVEDKITELIRDAKVLYDKLLYSDATKVLENAKRMASKYEKFTLLLEIVRCEKKIVFASSIYDNATEKDLTKLFEEESLIIKKIDNINEYWKQYGILYLYYRKNGVARKQEDIDRYNALINVPILKNEELALSYHAKRDFYKTHGNYSVAVNNEEESYLYCKKILSLMECHPHQIEDEPMKYLSVFYNLLSSTSSLKKYEELFNVIPKLKLMLKKFQLPFSIHLSTYALELHAYLKTGQFKKGNLLLPEIEALLKEQKNSNKYFELILITDIALLHFGNRDYHKSLVNLNIALDNKEINVSEKYYNFIKVFQLIVHFEKGNIELLPYIVKSVYRNLMQRKLLHKTESIFIRFIRTRLNNIRSTKDQIEAFKVLREELVNIGDDPMEAKFLDLFDIISWLESKIEDRPFGEILQEKSGYILRKQ